ncbi:hypothetical protein C7W88_07905 [Novosphingobium sp. THN1]|jgi:peptidoglycan/LPS O-acetylase OafA/YrhL|uniref:acyltransferase family protein n=1 Tax=Novosphingobium sp. THN1 TaxID=1016987 RepID=UPI000E47C5C2|nr:acyltransferase [Novosphingobium sp. THN1]AXU18970.1 hypothetical protein C7W88_07905 [Novosphingobium sp. THN1]
MERQKFFSEIVGLRIYLALWVAVGHGLQLSGWLKGDNPVHWLLLRTDAAVYVFMIVSGFVITNLIDSQKETYSKYIFRRLFRLYPAFIVCCVLGYLILPAWANLVSRVAWQNASGWQEYASSLEQLRYQSIDNTAPHFLLHATMLHGLIPTEVLPKASTAFLPAAWSISLEWQFYLIAPFLLSLRGKPFAMAAGAIAMAALHLVFYRGLLGHYEVASSILGVLVFFVVGIVSRLAYERLRDLDGNPFAWSALLGATTLAVLKDPIPLGIWAIFYPFLLWPEKAGVAFRLLFASKPAQILGEASYSLYLIHRPVQVVLAVMVVSVVPISSVGRQEMFITQLVAIAAALPISVAMYYWLERPAMRFAKRLTSQTALAPPELR